jgi:hypothetical protein
MKKYLVLVLVLMASKAWAGTYSTPVSVPAIVLVSSVTGTGAGGTVTISSPVATSYSTGLNTYLTNIHIEMYPVATIAGSPTPLKCTTTNLNSTAYFFNTVASSGTVQIMDMQFANPYAVPNPAINTVITCPATANIMWNIVTGYYQAP